MSLCNVCVYTSGMDDCVCVCELDGVQVCM